MFNNLFKKSAPVPPIAEKDISIPEGAEVIRVPAGYSDMTFAIVTSFEVKVGQKVSSNMVIAHLECDKATFELS